jgi:hypothetical protein
MIQRPTAFGLWLCEDVLVEEHTRSVTLLRHFDVLRVLSFPSPPAQFTVYAVLTDGLGPMTLRLVVAHADTLEEVYDRPLPRINLTDPLAITRVRFRVRSCRFPESGRYEFSLYAEEEVVATCLLRVTLKE